MKPKSEIQPPAPAVSGSATEPASDARGPAGGMPSRREMLVRGGAALGVLAGSTAVGRAVWDKGGFGVGVAEGARQVRDFRVPAARKETQFAELAIARAPKRDNAEQAPLAPGELVRKALDAMGGLGRFVSRGDIVVIKPNIGWDRMPVHAANTNPDVVAAVVQLAYEAGAKRVVVADGSCNDPNRCFQRSGIWRKAYAVGAEVVLPAEHRFRTMRLKGDVLDEWPIFTTLVDADKVINVPVAKHHNLAKFTASMKNWYGVLGGRRNRLHQNID
ncbi:MAG TPA: DUF362 domain-containing protein, partial [Polyangiaceae bacterium]|nr:DUF362 domain-containing protein [Polyangiaceae bacterium]